MRIMKTYNQFLNESVFPTRGTTFDVSGDIIGRLIFSRIKDGQEIDVKQIPDYTLTDHAILFYFGEPFGQFSVDDNEKVEELKNELSKEEGCDPDEIDVWFYPTEEEWDNAIKSDKVEKIDPRMKFLH